MAGVLIGFGIIGTIILIGYVVGRIDLLGPEGHRVLSQLVFFVLTPCLLFVNLSKADVHVLFSPILVVSTLSALVAAAVSVVILKFVLRRSLPEITMGTMAGAYVNANNIGLPVAVYVLGSATWVAPVLLFQLVILTPIVLTIMDITTNRGEGVPRWRTISRPFTNPLLIASLLGVLVSVTGLRIPTDAVEPFSLIGAAAVPVVLISFGMSLHGRKPLQAGPQRVDVLVESALKVVVMPLVAWILGAFVFDFGHEELFGTVVLAGLPSAQNAFNYAQRYQVGVVVARDTVLLTTIAAVPALVLVAALLK